MKDDARANSHTNMMIARLQRELEDSKDAVRRLKIQAEMDALRAELAK
jgi:hypothetical protein